MPKCLPRAKRKVLKSSVSTESLPAACMIDLLLPAKVPKPLPRIVSKSVNVLHVNECSGRTVKQPVLAIVKDRSTLHEDVNVRAEL